METNNLENTANPLTKHDTPPFDEQQQDAVPGKETEMDLKPDHGETSYKGSGKLSGKKAIITGGDSGIGRAVAIAFAREGADVLISYLDEHEDAKETAKFVEEAGRRAILVAGDISDEQHCKLIINRAIDEFGQLDVLVNNAAYQMSRDSIQDVSTEEWDQTFKTNIYPMFTCVKKRSST
jgi:NAD(P)-dependent dehydrogenase (short-subunit alcohol dehydrogenase family)